MRTFARHVEDSSHEFSEPNHEYRKYGQYPLCTGIHLRHPGSKRTFEKSSAMTPENRNRRELVINQFDAVSELLLEITLKGNAL